VTAAAGWPIDWEDRVGGKDCPICAGLGQGDNKHAVHVWDGSCTEVLLSRRTAVRGYCLVTWAGAHVADPTDLAPSHAASYWDDVLSVGRAVRAVFRPVKVNYLLLGNLVPHLHTHVVPRYVDDPAAGGPLSWELLVGAPPTAPQELRQQAADLRTALLQQCEHARGDSSLGKAAIGLRPVND
jgi:diadenosine tetraphosphate (Ap4A) HIT family hydrolase